MAEDAPAADPRRRVKRGEGEVTQWPRGLVGYTSRGPVDDEPSPEEDRTGNRIRLAARLLGILRSRGEDVTRPLAELHAAERAARQGRTGEATRRVEALLGELAQRHPNVPDPETQ